MVLTGKGRRWVLTAILVCLLGLEAAPATEQASSLKDYYGFGPMEILKLEWDLSRPVAADLNQDGLNDLIVINNRKSRIELLMQKRDFDPCSVQLESTDEDINDIFGQERNWRFARHELALDVAATSLVVSDLNRDGKLDVAYYSKEGLYIVRQESAGAAASSTAAGPVACRWQAPQRIDLTDGTNQPEALQAGDFDGDGRTDLVLLGDSELFVFAQQDDGQVAEPQRIELTGKRYRQFDLADLNGDRRLDVLLSTNDRLDPLMVRFTQADGRLGPEQKLPLSYPRKMQPLVLSDGTCAGLVTVNVNGTRVELLKYQVGGHTEAGGYKVQTYALPKARGAEKRDYTLADINGDGHADVVGTTGDEAELLVYLAQGDGALVGPQTFPGFKEMITVRHYRPAGSQDDVVVVLSREEKLIGWTRFEQGRLSYPHIVPTQGDPLAFEMIDGAAGEQARLAYVSRHVDEEADEDYFALHVQSQPTDQSASYPAQTLRLENLRDVPRGMLVADVDHDCVADIMIIPSYGPLLLVQQAEDGLYEVRDTNNMNEGLVRDINPQSVTVASLGPEQKDALLLTQGDFARALAFDGKTGWRVLDQYHVDDRRGQLVVATAFADLAGEHLDIAAYDRGQKKLIWWHRQDDNLYHIIHRIDVPDLSAKKLWGAIRVGNPHAGLLLAGQDKLITVQPDGDEGSLETTLSYQTPFKDDQFGAITFGDLNSDGILDVVLCEQQENHVQVLTQQAENGWVNALRFKVFEKAPRGSDHRPGQGVSEPQSALVADVTGDGRADLILHVHDRLIIYPQD